MPGAGWDTSALADGLTPLDDAAPLADTHVPADDIGGLVGGDLGLLDAGETDGAHGISSMPSADCNCRFGSRSGGGLALLALLPLLALRPRRRR